STGSTQAEKAHHHADAVTSAEASTSYVCPMHPEVTSDTPGSCPKCGMDLVPQAEAGGHAHSGHGSHKHHAHTPAQEGQGGHAAHGAHGQQDAHSEHHGHAGHGAAPDIPGIEPHFMSMVELTEGKPVSPDGLVMEWIDAPFGPFFPGLPSGLHMVLTLDGDSVAGAEIRGMEAAALPSGVALEDFAASLADAVPLSPVAMRELACRAAEAATGQTAPKDVLTARAAAVERERIASHLNWLAGLARQAGLAPLGRRAAAMEHRVRTAKADDVAEQATSITSLLHVALNRSLMGPKLTGIGTLQGASEGPVARAAGHASDARHGDGVYDELGFEPITQDEGDAMARLRQRCAEIAQSLDLIAEAGAIAIPVMPRAKGDGHGMATLETPRGPATLHLTLKGGMVSSTHLTTPFAALAAHVPDLIKQMELADALTAIASLDLDPWSASQ
ncbi:heavy metal-binding domain-containing protein, partial [Pseudogemmobacter bohemicus]|uniref:heavy metal-binding domain-containing protein n=1 Tax=Pseudogemmobacter bohemicus TaxID=2250708 RepID=UPI002FCD8721